MGVHHSIVGDLMQQRVSLIASDKGSAMMKGICDMYFLFVVLFYETNTPE